MRALSELLAVDDPAWPGLAADFAAAGEAIRVLPADRGVAEATLLRLQVTARSNLGGFVLNCGGLLIDGGWLRVYGSPSADAGIPSLASVNGFPDAIDEGGLILAHDVLGGAFRLNGPNPGEGGEPGEIAYFGPDSLSWSGLGGGHSAWLAMLAGGGLDHFYADLRWPGWAADVSALTAFEALSVYPPPWSREGADIGAASRRAVPLAEVLAFASDNTVALTGTDPGFLGHARHPA